MPSLCLTLVLCLAAGKALPADFTLPAPPGPFAVSSSEPSARSAGFAPGDPVIATTYFYWYDAASKAHILNPDGSDGLTDHPPTLDGFSYRNVAWHAAQLEDMIAAGIDVVMPVYWGTPLEKGSWSNVGLPKLVAAREQLRRAGKRPPAIGMFYDTTTLQHNGGGYHVDLRTAAGRRWFYGTIRDFFSLIPPQHRARIDGKPLVFLYSPGFANGVDERLFPAVRQMFHAQFGTGLYLVKMLGWPGAADSLYMWGGAIRPQMFDVAAFGPGYDHSAVPGRKPLVRDRDNGRFYARGWQSLLARPPARRPWLVHLETWNELHEGTDLCESREYGRQYIDLTRHYADLFHARKRFPPSDRRPLPAKVSASPTQTAGLRLLPQPTGDGAVLEKTVAGRRAWTTRATRRSPHRRYLYFDLDDGFAVDEQEPLEVTVHYFDAGPAEFWFEYDSADPNLTGLRQAFRAGCRHPIGGTQTWKRKTFMIAYPRLSGRANGADFRLGCRDADLAISYIGLSRPDRRRQDPPIENRGREKGTPP